MSWEHLWCSFFSSWDEFFFPWGCAGVSKLFVINRIEQKGLTSSVGLWNVCCIFSTHPFSCAHTLSIGSLPRRNLTSAAPWRWPLWWGTESARVCNQSGFGIWISTSKQVYIDNSNSNHSTASARWGWSTHLSIFLDLDAQNRLWW